MQRVPWQEVYEHGLVPAIFAHWSHRTIELVRPQPDDSILDVACGTGVVTRLVAQYVRPEGYIAGLDANAGMIEVARKLPASAGNFIDWYVADALELPWPDETFHIVYCQGGLQFFPDRLTALREMYRVLRPGGKIVAMVCQDIKYCPGFAIVSDLLAQRIGSQMATVIRIPFAIPGAAEVRSLVTSAGFSDIVVHPKIQMIRFSSPEKFVECLITGSTLSPKVNDDMLASLIQEASKELHTFVNDEGLAFPMRANFVVAQKAFVW